MLILKNSEKYTVFKIKKKNKNLILKISNRGPEKITREVKHIQKLKNSSDFFKKNTTNYSIWKNKKRYK